MQATSSKHFDAQIDVQNIMNSATHRGGRFGHVSTLAVFVGYCLKSSNIPMKFVYGFFLVYWYNHAYTMGTYLGALLHMPKAYRRVGRFVE